MAWIFVILPIRWFIFKIRHILQLVADNTGFLIEDRLLKLIDKYPLTSRNLCTLDSIFMVSFIFSKFLSHFILYIIKIYFPHTFFRLWKFKQKKISSYYVKYFLIMHFAQYVSDWKPHRKWWNLLHLQYVKDSLIIIIVKKTICI